ncbi:MAG: CoA-binding protein [Patescibacteria group bacterium]
MPSVAIIGASANRSKYGNKAVRAYLEAGWTVYPINLHEKTIEGIPAFAHVADVGKPINRVALYLPPAAGMAIINEIAACAPREVFFNPGSESDDLIARARELGLQPTLGCAIINIGKKPSSYS